MLISIHQPNYLPWSGFFQKMMMCSQFVFLDVVPFSKNSYQNRCKIKTSQGAKWLTVPVLQRGHFGQATNDVQIEKNRHWALKHLRTITQNYSRAPFFDFLLHLIEPALNTEWDYLAELNIELISRIAEALGIGAQMFKASDLGVAGSRSELLCSICQRLGASEYLSGPSGRDYLDIRSFEAQEIKVSYHSFKPQNHAQLYGDFIPGLSVVDLLANCGPGSKDFLAGQGEKKWK